ncbi:MAG TPA: sensor histidine kinase [Bacilli bacterium]
MKYIMRPVVQWFRNLKLKQKLFLSYVVLIILPLSVYTYFSYVQIANLVKQQTIVSANQIFGEAAASISKKIHGLVKTLDFVSVDSNINDVIIRDMENYDINKQIFDYNKLQGFLFNLERNNDLYHIRLYFDNEAIYTHEKLNIFTLDEIKPTSWYKELAASNSTTIWFKPPPTEQRADSHETRLVSAARFIWNLKGLSQKAGISRVDISESSLQTILSKAKITDHSSVYLQNSQGEIMASSQLAKDVPTTINPKLLSTLPELEWTTARFNNREMMVNYQRIENTDWNLVSIIPLNEVFAAITEKRNQLFLFMFIIATFAYFLAYYISDFSTKSINQLIRRMRKVQTGDLDAIISKYGKDEIGDLVESFNFMLQKITVLIEEQFQSGKALKQAELKTLQAQINPHFLYNSLDVINCIAINRKMPDISQMVIALTNFYKLGLNKGKEIVTIQDEIEHVQVYVEIQNIRFENSIHLVIDLPDEMCEYPILKISLQPLVENAILHGIFEKPEQTGTITISGHLADDCIILFIADDGVGIPQEVLDRLFEPDLSESKHGFGIKNIQDRLVLTYGDKYGLNIKSVVGEGTRVEMKFPLT